MSAARIEWIRVNEGNRLRALGLEIQWVGDPGARTGQRLSLIRHGVPNDLVGIILGEAVSIVE
jgi:hypothetical protein